MKSPVLHRGGCRPPPPDPAANVPTASPAIARAPVGGSPWSRMFLVWEGGNSARQKRKQEKLEPQPYATCFLL